MFRLEIKDLYYSYPDGHSALNGVNLNLAHGERVALIYKTRERCFYFIILNYV